MKQIIIKKKKFSTIFVATVMTIALFISGTYASGYTGTDTKTTGQQSHIASFTTTDDMSATPYAIITKNGGKDKYNNDTYDMTFIRTYDTLSENDPNCTWDNKELVYVCKIDEEKGNRDWNTYGLGGYCNGYAGLTTSVTFYNTIAPKQMDYWFRTFPECTFDFSKLDTSQVTSMSYMFKGSYMKNLDLSGFDTSNVTNMYCMFDHCDKLEQLNISNFDTSNVTNMDSMFDYCTSLKTLDLSSFNTSNVTQMQCMFAYCYSLYNIDISNFDTSNVKHMEFMFCNCRSLKNLDISNFDTSNVQDIMAMFFGATNLNIDCSNWNVESVYEYDKFNSYWDKENECYKVIETIIPPNWVKNN